jgi:hypothetical protein
MDFQGKDFSSIISRNIEIKPSNKIHTIIGPRRTGKTYLMYKLINDLKVSDINRNQMVYLNFENPLFYDLNFKQIREIIELHWSLFPETTNKKLHIFIDEPQVIKNWEVAIREIYDNFNCHIFITGSSSKLLSKEIATSLRGRAITTHLLPLSFKEFLKFRKFESNVNKLNTKEKAILSNLFDEYLKFGGYPEISLEQNETEKLKILKNYFDLVIYKDLIERYKITNTKLIKWFIDYLISSLTKETSINNVYNTLKSKQIKISKNTLYDYFSMLEDSFFIFPVRRFDYSIKNENLSIPKIYLNDHGFLNLFSIEEFGKRIENIVYLELLRKQHINPIQKINYWKSADNKEVDFIVGEGKNIKQAIQVCYDINDERTKQREITSLVRCLEYFKLKEGLIITRNTKSEEKVDGKKIRIIPIIEWLLIK